LPTRSVVLACGALFIATTYAACGDTDTMVTMASGLQYQVLSPGAGPAAEPGHTVRVHETTTLGDGTILFSTRARNAPVAFVLGANQVIAGVDEGVRGMRVGERRRLVIPPALSRRSSYPPNTPPDSLSTLTSSSWRLWASEPQRCRELSWPRIQRVVDAHRVHPLPPSLRLADSSHGPGT
jgi:hypothetical protein